MTAAGYGALLSSCWYLDRIARNTSWQSYYKCDPHDFTGTPAQKARVLGGEACLWDEYVDSTNLTPRLWLVSHPSPPSPPPSAPDRGRRAVRSSVSLGGTEIPSRPRIGGPNPAQLDSAPLGC